MTVHRPRSRVHCAVNASIVDMQETWITALVILQPCLGITTHGHHHSPVEGIFIAHTRSGEQARHGALMWRPSLDDPSAAQAMDVMSAAEFRGHAAKRPLPALECQMARSRARCLLQEPGRKWSPTRSTVAAQPFLPIATCHASSGMHIASVRPMRCSLPSAWSDQLALALHPASDNS